MKISEFIGEATEYDKKETLEERRPKSWLKSVSAFANGVGGGHIDMMTDLKYIHLVECMMALLFKTLILIGFHQEEETQL